MSVLPILNSGNPGLSSLTPPFSLSPACTHTHKLSWPRTLQFQGKLYAFSPPFQSSYLPQNDDVELEGDEAAGIGDCLVFEEGVFEDPYLQNDSSYEKKSDADKKTKRKKKRNTVEIDAEDLIPEKWKQIQEEMNMTKKEKRKIRQQIEFGSRVEKRRQGYLPVRNLKLEEYLTYKETKLAQLRPLVLENPSNFREAEDSEEEGETDVNVSSSERLAPKNPKWAVYGRGLDDVSEFFNSGQYEPPDKKSEGPRKLFSKEEKVLLNKKMPDLASATSKKWLPLHTLAASGEFYLVDALLKHNVDINVVAKDGLTALHKAIIGKKQAVTNYLLRESANPFVHDEDGATLLHYAVQTASSPAIKMLLLYNVDINLQDNDGWTPLHLAVQGRRTDIVKLLLIKGADKTLKNNDGLTPLGLCLYSGRDTRTYELIKLLKQLPRTP